MPARPEFRTVFTYPWDLDDEGPDRALDVIQKDAQITGVSLAVSYHIATYFLPHNPRRKFYYGEDGMALFSPDEKIWADSRLRPRVSELVKDRDWLPRIVERIRARGLPVTFWTVFLYNHYLARTNPNCCKQDALGNRYLSQLCPANPEVRRYVLAMTEDLARNYRPDAFYIESLSYLGYNYGFLNPKVFTPVTPRAEFLLNLCFCEHCRQAASDGLDAERLREDVAAWLERDLARMPTPVSLRPADEEWLELDFGGRVQHFLSERAEVATSLYEATVKTMRAGGAVAVEAAYATASAQTLSGLLPEFVNPLADRLGVGVPDSRQQMELLRKEIKPAQKLLANLQPANVTSRSQIADVVRQARETGVDGFTFYNYGLLRLEQLDWIGRALEPVSG